MQVLIWGLTALKSTTPDKALGLPFPLACLHSGRHVQNGTRAGWLNLCSGLIVSDTSPSPGQSTAAEHVQYNLKLPEGCDKLCLLPMTCLALSTPRIH